MDFDHAFVICAYGCSPHLEDCILSLKNQELAGSRILLATSTPSPFIEQAAGRHGLPLHINSTRAGIGEDWDFALSQGDARFVTIAHQDDTYHPAYTKAMAGALARHPGALLAFTDYSEHEPGGPRRPNINMRIKRLLCELAFLGREAITGAAAKRRLFALGNPVCCPSVTLHRALLPRFRFSPVLKTNLDWEAWARLADEPGGFVYVREPLVSKQIHAASETSVTIGNRTREQEDRIMLERFWPTLLAGSLLRLYRLSYRANRPSR